MKPELSIIIIDYKSKNLLPNCLRAIKENIKIPHEVILVDNNEENRGFAKGANLGAKKAKGKFLLFLNPDCLIQSGDFSKLVEYLNQHPKTGIVGLKMILKNGAIQPYSFGNKYSLTRSILSKLGAGTSPKNLTPDWVSGGAMIARKNLFEAIGGFDEQFFMYFEDQDLCLGAKKVGHEIAIFPEIVVTHLGGEPATGSTYGDVCGQQKMYRESQKKFIQKHYGKAYSLIFRTIRGLWKIVMPHPSS